MVILRFLILFRVRRERRKMTNRENLQEELLKFCKYIEEWFPEIQKITVFGSYLWDESPNDIDIWIEGKTNLLGNSYKYLFPNLHVKKHKPNQDDLIVQKTVWNRKDGVVNPIIPILSILNYSKLSSLK